MKNNMKVLNDMVIEILEEEMEKVAGGVHSHRRDNPPKFHQEEPTEGGAEGTW